MTKSGRWTQCTRTSAVTAKRTLDNVMEQLKEWASACALYHCKEDHQGHGKTQGHETSKADQCEEAGRPSEGREASNADQCEEAGVSRCSLRIGSCELEHSCTGHRGRQ